MLRVLPVLLLIIGGVAYYALASSPSRSARIDQVALADARAQMVWSQGPTVQSTQILKLGQLSAALARSVPLRVAQDVNVQDLERRYGPQRTVALVVVNGVYNTLPPDEGVNLRGDAVVIVDVRTNRALFLTN
jgi:hypothetical protein